MSSRDLTIYIRDNGLEYIIFRETLKKKRGYYIIEIPLQKALPEVEIEIAKSQEIIGMKLNSTKKWTDVVIKELKISGANSNWPKSYVSMKLQLMRFVRCFSFSLLTSNKEVIKFRIEFPSSSALIRWYPCVFPDKDKYDIAPLNAISFRRYLSDQEGSKYNVIELAEKIDKGAIKEKIVWIRGGTAAGKTTFLQQLKRSLIEVDKGRSESRIIIKEMPIYDIIRKDYDLMGKRRELLTKAESIHAEIEVGDKCDKRIVVIYLDEMDVLFNQFAEYPQTVSEIIATLFVSPSQKKSCQVYLVIADFLDYHDRIDFFPKTIQSVKQFELQPIKSSDVKEILDKFPLSSENARFFSSRIDWLVEEFAGNNPLLILAALSDAMKLIWDGKKEHIIADRTWEDIFKKDGQEIASAIRYLCDKSCGGESAIVRGNIGTDVVNLLPNVVSHPAYEERIRIAEKAGLVRVRRNVREVIHALHIPFLYAELKSVCDDG